MIKWIKKLPPTINIIITIILLILFVVFYSLRDIIGDISIIIQSILVIILAFFMFLSTKSKKCSYELDEYIEYDSKNIDEIENNLKMDNFKYSLISDDYIYFKMINKTLVQIDLRRHFGIKKYEPQNKDIISNLPEYKNSINIMIVPNLKKKTKYFATRYGSYDKNNLYICLSIKDNKMTRYTHLGDFEMEFNKILKKYFK